MIFLVVFSALTLLICWWYLVTFSATYLERIFFSGTSERRKLRENSLTKVRLENIKRKRGDYYCLILKMEWDGVLVLHSSFISVSS